MMFLMSVHLVFVSAPKKKTLSLNKSEEAIKLFTAKEETKKNRELL